MRDEVRAIPPGDPPGSRYSYCTPDSLVLDWARERATGRSFQAALAALWATIEAERPAVVGLDQPEERGGVAMAGGALAATARDWARLGTLQIDGRWAGRQVVSRGWVDASSTPERDFLMPGRLPSTITTHAGFGYHWWPLDARGDRVMADGMRGQFVYVDRPQRVVVKTSVWPYEDSWRDRQCRDLTYLALPVIADASAAIMKTTTYLQA
ncbi:MAG: serine hydrolase [Streptosporangiaceae bacterium]